MFFSSPANAQTFMPPAGTAIAHQIDLLYGFLLIVSFISCVLVIGGFVYFGYKYRRKSAGQYGAWITHNNVAEFLWSFIPFLIFMLVFVWGWIIYNGLRTMPVNGLEIGVQAQKWSWTFLYKSGRNSSGEFYVPVDTDVKLIMTSKDVIHSLYIPAFRNKMDAVPGRYTTFSFRANKLGDFQIFCTEYCGDQHSGMLAKLHVVTREKYEEWLGNDPYKGLPLAEIGQKVHSKSCVACHSLDGKVGVGPSWKGAFGRKEDLTNGSSVTVEENYIGESIVDPNAKVVKGFSPVMPSFAGQLNEQELMGVVEFIKTLK